MSQDTPAENSLAAARLELMVLRASLGEVDRMEEGVVAVAPTPIPVTVEQAAHVLARIPKPVVCTASVPIGGVLLVECQPIGTIEESGLHNAVRNGLSHQFPVDRAGRSDDERMLLVCGSGERLNLSLAAFRRWYEEYLPPTSVALGHYPPTSADQPEGGELEGVIRLLHVSPVDPEDIPPELRFLRPP